MDGLLNGNDSLFAHRQNAHALDVRSLSSIHNSNDVFVNGIRIGSQINPHISCPRLRLKLFKCAFNRR